MIQCCGPLKAHIPYFPALLRGSGERGMFWFFFPLGIIIFRLYHFIFLPRSFWFSQQNETLFAQFFLHLSSLEFDYFFYVC